MSAFDRYAARAFDAQAADYVIKPFHDQRLLQAIERAKLRVQMERNRSSISPSIESAHHEVLDGPKYLERLALQKRSRIFFQKVQLVDSFTSDANYVRVHCGSTEHLMRSTMNDLEHKLDPRQFVRIHRCAIINIECLREFRRLPFGDYVVKLTSGRELRMSKNYRQHFRDALSALTCPC